MEKNSENIIKIAIVGPESTGKSSLSKALAQHYNEPWVTEVAREYIDKLNRPYTLKDIEIIAELQLLEEEKQIVLAKKYLFCDTTLLVNKIWASFVFNHIPSSIIELYKPQNYLLHLLCDIDLPWEFDPLREHPNHRETLLKLYENDLIESAANFVKVKGMAQMRVQNAIEAVKQLNH
jgi:nicotinamide riboside kinase